ncbi:MAG TPA: TetR/AcrR family transcriptional regulator [Mycobacteriales bacterium]|jgi:TetR/AcrR family transcriptional repressor of nem operon|nr:TetR/AcrR family transcriptional regulator [Mycobacteriales bacterium]
MARTREFDTDAAVARAMDVFWCKGYEATSIADLVEATGVQRGSLYAAFGSKQGLYYAALDRYREELGAPMLAALSSGAGVREVVRSLLVGLVEQAVADAGRRGCLMVNAATERLREDRGVSTRVRSTVTAMQDALTDALAEAQRLGQLREDASPAALAGFVVLAVQGIRVMGVIDPDRRRLLGAVEVALGCLD